MTDLVYCRSKVNGIWHTGSVQPQKEGAGPQ